MVWTIAHELSGEAGSQGATSLKALYTYMAANPALFTIVDFGGGITATPPTNGAWFVFSVVGHAWQCWLGGANSTAPGWHTDNRVSWWGAWDAYTWHANLAPNGGWNVGVDDPTVSGAMFSLAGGNRTGIGSIMLSGTSGSVVERATCWVDTTEGVVILARESTAATANLGHWNTAAVIGSFFEPTYSAQDTYPVAIIGGEPMIDAGSEFLLSSGTSPAIHSLAMDFDDTTAIQLNVDGFYDSTDNLTQPGAEGYYDSFLPYIYSRSAGKENYRGRMKSSCVRVVHNYAGDRRVFSGGDWIVLSYGTSAEEAAIAVPWDPTIKPRFELP